MLGVANHADSEACTLRGVRRLRNQQPASYFQRQGPIDRLREAVRPNTLLNDRAHDGMRSICERGSHAHTEC
jgi:hypothetical protein